MSTEDGQQNTNNSNTSENPQPQPTQQTQQQQQNPTPVQSGHSPGPTGPAAWATELTAAVNALPERIVHSMREAASQAPQPTRRQSAQSTQDSGNNSQQSQQSQQQTQTQEPGSAPPGMSKLAKWWFG